MKASLCLEAIGHGEIQKLKLWDGIAREGGIGGAFRAAIGRPMQYARWSVEEIDAAGSHVAWIYGRTDYSQANSKGSRGVRIWYALESGRRYRVRSPQSWKSVDEYCCHVDEAGAIVRE